MIDVIELQAAEAHYGVPLERVVSVLPRVRITPLAGTEPPLAGYVNHRGEPLPVIDLRLRFGEVHPPPRLTDHLLIVRTARRQVALLADRVLGVRRVDPTGAVASPQSSEAVAGVIALADGLLFVTDLDRLLSLEEERDLDEALHRLREESAA